MEGYETSDPAEAGPEILCCRLEFVLGGYGYYHLVYLGLANLGLLAEREEQFRIVGIEDIEHSV